MSQLQDNIDEFHRLGAEVFGISVDSHHSLRVWSEQMGFTYPFLSDLDRTAMTAYETKVRDYGLYHDISRRAIFVVDKSGRIAFKDIVTERGVTADVNGALDAVRGLASS